MTFIHFVFSENGTRPTQSRKLEFKAKKILKKIKLEFHLQVLGTWDILSFISFDLEY
jgi:hypothetical protein